MSSRERDASRTRIRSAQWRHGVLACRLVFTLVLVLALALTPVVGGPSAEANVLRLIARIRGEQQASFVPKARNFRMCFKADASGAPVLSLCAEEPPSAADAPVEPGPAGERRPADEGAGGPSAGRSPDAGCTIPGCAPGGSGCDRPRHECP